MKIYSFIVIFMMTTGVLLAQNVDIDSILRVGKLNDVVITAQFAPQSGSNAVYKVKAIHAAEIRQKSATNLSELLQDEMNIDLGQNSVFGSNIEIQGVSKENIKILIDGVPVIGRLNGIIDLSQINLSNIERVEIVEGPVSIFYGTDAMGGILNLITKKKQKETIEGNASYAYESIHAQNFSAGVGYSAGKNLIRINLGNYQFKGLSTIDSVRSANWPRRNNYFGDLMLSRKIGKMKLMYNTRLSKHVLFSIGDPDKKGKIFDKDYFTRRIDNVLNLNGFIFGDKYLDVTASYLDYQRYHDTYKVDPVSFVTVLSEKDTREKNIVQYQYGGVKASLGRNSPKALNYMVGTDINTETSSGTRIKNKKQTISTAALFVSVNYNLLNAIALQPGLRYTWNSAYGSLLSPAMNLKWAINDNNKLRLSYARGFRAPTIKELYLDFHISAGPKTFIISGNEDLEVEQSHSFNLQYSLRTKIGKSALLVAPSLYYNTFSNLIDLSVLKDDKRNYINVEESKTAGGRVDLAYSPVKDLLIKLGYGQTGRYNRFNDEQDSDAILFTPEVSSSVSYHMKKTGLHFNAFYKYSGKRKGFYYDKKSKSIKETLKEDYHNLSLNISKDLFKDKVNIQLGGKNLFDVKDVAVANADGTAHSRNLQLWGRSYFAKATVNF